MVSFSEQSLEVLGHQDDKKILVDQRNLIGYVHSNRTKVHVRFWLQYKGRGQSHRYYIGVWPKRSLDEINDEVKWARRLLHDGINPTLAKLARKKEEAQRIHQAFADQEKEKHKSLTVYDLFKEWLPKGVRRKNNNAELKRLFGKDVLPYIGHIPVSALTEEDIKDVLNRQIERGVVRLATRTLADMRQMFRWAEKRPPWRALLIQANPALLIDNRIFNPEGVSQKRDRVLSPAEIYELAQAFRTTESDYLNAENRRHAGRPLTRRAQLAVWICLGTTCRIGELLKSRWDEVDLYEGVWFVPKANTKGAHQDYIVYMSDFVRKQFVQLYEITGHTDFCFPARNYETRATHVCVKSVTKQISDRQTMFRNISGSLKKRPANNSLVLASGTKGAWTPHDLRRTGATMMQRLGIPLDVIDRCQNHVLQGSQVRRHYLHYDYAKETAQAWDILGKEIESILQNTPTNLEDSIRRIRHPLNNSNRTERYSSFML